MSPDGKVKVVVRSRKVPTAVVHLHRQVYSPSGIHLGETTDSKVLYDYVLDEGHRRTITEADKLARSLRLDLVVIDSAKQGFFSRTLSSLGRRGTANPTIEVVSPSSATSDHPPAMVRAHR